MNKSSKFFKKIIGYDNIKKKVKKKSYRKIAT